MRRHSEIVRMKQVAKRRPIIELSRKEARKFFLKGKSYCEIDLPSYFQFAGLLKSVARVLKGKSLSSFRRVSPREFDNVNHLIMSNKDGRYAWRPLELIHPALYVSLVNAITEKDNWNQILKRFRQFRRNSRIKCLSLPVKSLTKQTDRAEQISHWWIEVEQQSLELSLEYEMLIHTDIVDCYAAFYTHSIAWALHGKKEAKKKRRDLSLIGNLIDKHIMDMRHGQTNGIPQGSVLMDFIAEMILGYSDTRLSKRIAREGIKNYQILRYRDDYRIFVNSRPDGERILKCLTEVMIDFGLKLNEAKTSFNENLIQSSIKDAKLKWMFRRHWDRNLQKHLLIIHDHGICHPNAGTLRPEMLRFHRRLFKRQRYNRPLPLIGIVTEIARHNPRVYSLSATIISKLISFLGTTVEKKETIEKIRNRFSKIPNTGHMDLWLQRVTFPIEPSIKYKEPLCRLVRQDQVQLWNNDWIDSPKLKKSLDPKQVVNRKKLGSMPPVVPPIEVETFADNYY